MREDVRKAISAASAAGPRKLLDLWARWQGSDAQAPESAVLVAEALIQMARPDDALAVLQDAGEGP